MRAAVVVAGDLGRSPRMQYHAHALAANGVDVDLIGYHGVPLPKILTSDPRITIHRLGEPRFRRGAGRSTIAYGLFAALDGLRASLQLGTALMKIPRPDLLLVQNPPALPTLHVAWVIKRLRGVRLVIDWHNVGYSILALRLGRRHAVVRLARWLEMIAARSADAHLCVSRGFAVSHDQFKLTSRRPRSSASAFVPIDRVERERSGRRSSFGLTFAQ